MSLTERLIFVGFALCAIASAALPIVILMA